MILCFLLLLSLLVWEIFYLIYEFWSPESCKSRRKERVWDPEESSWTEDPEYFEMVAWPEYLNSVAKVKESMGEVKMLDSTLDNVDDNFKVVLREILDKTDQRH